jgi:16S rRNA C1402 (ribose-2'-O) methylase RsmI
MSFADSRRAACAVALCLSRHSHDRSDDQRLPAAEGHKLARSLSVQPWAFVSIAGTPAVADGAPPRNDP